MKKAKRLALVIALGVIGAAPAYYGAFKILFADYSTKTIDLSIFNIDLEPREISVPYIYTPIDGTPIVKRARATFTTMDLFAVGNPVHLSISAEVYNGTDVKNMAYLIVSPNTDFSWLNHTNINEYFQNNDDVIHLAKTGENTFGREIDLTFPSEGTFALFGLVNSEKYGLQRLNQHEGDYNHISVQSSSDWLQLTTNRLTVAEIEQSKTSDFLQQRSNIVIEGLSWIILAWIPFELAIRFWFEYDK